MLLFAAERCGVRDGGRSLIRKTAAIPFPGWDASLSCLVADVDLSQEPPWGLHRHPSFHSFFKFEGTESVRVMVTEPEEATSLYLGGNAKRLLGI